MIEPWDDINHLVKRGLITVEWPNASILDLGFGGSILPVLSFYSKYGFLKYVGVDKIPSEVFERQSWFMHYQRHEVEGGVPLPEITEDEFYRRFTCIYDREILSHLENERSQYDLVVLSSLSCTCPK